MAGRGEGVRLFVSPKSHRLIHFMSTYKANSNRNQKVIYADKSLEKFENLSLSFSSITQINDSLWLELG